MTQKKLMEKKANNEKASLLKEVEHHQIIISIKVQADYSLKEIMRVKGTSDSTTWKEHVPFLMENSNVESA